MIRYREATYEDAITIATLHAESWRVTYRGSYRDEYLDGPVFQDGIDVWERRLSTPSANQFVVLAEEEDLVVGFACAYGHDDEQWARSSTTFTSVASAIGEVREHDSYPR